MDCQHCGSETVAFETAGFEQYLPGEESAVAICTRCLAVEPVPEMPSTEPAFDRVHPSFPDNREGAIAFALLLGLLPNLALYRQEISDLLERVEHAGTDPLLALDRLSTDSDIETDLDLAGRRRQLEQLL